MQNNLLIKKNFVLSVIFLAPFHVLIAQQNFDKNTAEDVQFIVDAFNAGETSKVINADKSIGLGFESHVSIQGLDKIVCLTGKGFNLAEGSIEIKKDSDLESAYKALVNVLKENFKDYKVKKDKDEYWQTTEFISKDKSLPANMIVNINYLRNDITLTIRGK